jgi:hypothetical protein
MKFGRAPTTLIIRSIALVQKAELKLRQEVYSWVVLEHKRAAFPPQHEDTGEPKLPQCLCSCELRLFLVSAPVVPEQVEQCSASATYKRANTSAFAAAGDSAYPCTYCCRRGDGQNQVAC